MKGQEKGHGKAKQGQHSSLGTRRKGPTGRRREGPLTFIDLFAGIGGFRLALERAAGKKNISCVFSSEWDRFARETYQANFGDLPAGDIRKIDAGQIPSFDLLCAGFPCQAFSIAGVSKKNALGRPHGFLDKSQGTLFFEIARIARAHRPRALLLENVKNLLSHDRGRTFAVIRDILEQELGYHLHFEIINARHLLPQNRARIFLVAFREQAAAAAFRFPALADETGRNGASPLLGEILERRVDPKYILSDHLWNYLQAYRAKHSRAGNGFGYTLTGRNEVARTLSARYYKDGSEILVPVRGRNPRRLTPRECARLMGFPDDFQIPVSDTQAYKQFGNSVAVPVVERVARRLLRALSKMDRRRASGGISGEAGAKDPIGTKSRRIA